MRFIYVLPFAFYVLTALFMLNLPSGSGEQFTLTAINLICCVVTTALAVTVFVRRGM